MSTRPLRTMDIMTCVVLLLPLGCGGGANVDPDPAPGPAAASATGEPVARGDLIQEVLPLAEAGQQGWDYAFVATADLDGDGRDERAVLISNVEMVDRQPLWDHGHHWQLYVETASGERTYMYSRFVPHGLVEVWLTRPDDGDVPRIVLVERWPRGLSAYEFTYRGGDDYDVIRHFTYELDPSRGFIGPNPS